MLWIFLVKDRDAYNVLRRCHWAINQHLNWNAISILDQRINPELNATLGDPRVWDPSNFDGDASL